MSLYLDLRHVPRPLPWARRLQSCSHFADGQTKTLKVGFLPGILAGTLTGGRSLSLTLRCFPPLVCPQRSGSGLHRKLQPGQRVAFEFPGPGLSPVHLAMPGSRHGGSSYEGATPQLCFSWAGLLFFSVSRGSAQSTEIFRHRARHAPGCQYTHIPFLRHT